MVMKDAERGGRCGPGIGSPFPSSASSRSSRRQHGPRAGSARGGRYCIVRSLVDYVRKKFGLFVHLLHQTVFIQGATMEGPGDGGFTLLYIKLINS